LRKAAGLHGEKANRVNLSAQEYGGLGTGKVEPQTIGTAPRVDAPGKRANLNAQTDDGLKLLVFGVTYVLAATLGQWPTLSPGLTATLWAPSGLTLAVLLVTDRSGWWKFICVGLAADLGVEALLYGFSPPASATVAIGNILEGVAGASLVRWWCGEPFSFSGVREVLAILLLAAIPSTMISATFGAATLAATGVESFAPAWLLWWIGDAVGVIIVAPLSLVILREIATPSTWRLNRVIEATSLFVALLVVTQIFFSGRFPYAFIILPFLVWAALRFGSLGAAIAMAVLAVMTFGFVSAGFEPFAGPAITPYERTIIVQAFLVVTAVSTLVLAALTEQRNSALDALKAAHALLETKVLERTAALRASEEFRELALESAGAGEWSWDIIADRLSWSDRYRALLGFAGDQPREFNAWLQQIHPDDRERLQLRAEHMLATPGDNLWSEEFRRVHPKHGLMWFGGRAHLKRDANGTALRMTGITIDVTQRRQAEIQARLHQNAQSRLARLGALGELTAGIAHEINQPLMASGTYVRLIGEVLAQEPPQIDIARRSAKQAAAQIERASGVVRGLRELIQLGRISTAPASARKLVEQSIELVRPELERASISIHVRIPNDLPAVRADILQIEQVLINLLRNAIDAIASVEITNGKIQVEVVATTGAFVKFSICDSGPGFAAEQAGHPPQHFSTTKADGLGFGLPLSSSIVTAHGGELWIGENDKGGRVFFTLPVVGEKVQ
jgi:PAS domain S-box-containing protein